MIASYLEKHAFKNRLIYSTPNDGLKLVIVIPCYNEDDVLLSLQSLLNCERTNFAIEVIVVINYSESENEQYKIFNQKTYNEIEEFALSNNRDNFVIYPIKAFDLPSKHAGVGLARKIGMDEALRRFELAEKKNGIICAFDADATVAPNYIKEIHNYFTTYPQHWGCSIYYEHPLEDLQKGSVEYRAIYEYELHLRYHIQCLKLIKYPFSNHTVGSSMAVTAFGYASLGGMNKRKAGEDFYFLHKFSVINRLGELNSTTIYPSPRSSDRVPFGTGRAVSQLLESNHTLDTYHMDAFVVLGNFMVDLEHNPKMKLGNIKDETLKKFMSIYDFDAKMKEIELNTNSKAAFLQRFYRFLNPFLCMKWLHYYRDNTHDNIDVYVAATMLLDEMGITYKQEDLLMIFRELDKI